MAHAHGWQTESAFIMERFPCPKCGRSLVKSGEAVVADQTFPIFQCDECVADVEMFGEKVETALTFAVGADGKPFDPAAPDGSLPI
jgi:hypothetical protein